MPRGYLDEQGNRIYQSEGVQNLTFEHLFPKSKAQPWYCTKCASAVNMNSIATFDIKKMRLLPLNKDKPAQYWECTNCRRRITIKERDQTFEEVRSKIITEYELHRFTYVDSWSIELSQFIGNDRLDSKRRLLTPGMRRELINELLDNIEDKLAIQIENLREYFQE